MSPLAVPPWGYEGSNGPHIVKSTGIYSVVDAQWATTSL